MHMQVKNFYEELRKAWDDVGTFLMKKDFLYKIINLSSSIFLKPPCLLQYNYKHC